MDKPVTTRKDLEARIIAKAWKDATYKERLLKDPKSVLQQELYTVDPSIKLPDNLQVFVYEESSAAFHLVLPRDPREISPTEVIGNDLEASAPQTVQALRMG